jgi:hypothetical protein
MTTSDTQSTATPDTDFTKTWRYKIGLTMIIVGNLGIVLALAMPALGAGAGTVGAMVVGGEIISLASIAFLGKAGFMAIKSKFTGFVKSTYTGPIGKGRHYFGITLLCVNIITTATLMLYAWDSFSMATQEVPNPVVWGLDISQQANMVEWLFLSGEISFLIAIYVLGADWWGRFRRIFVWEGQPD